MATTHIHRAPSRAQQRAYERSEDRNSYAAIWGILAVAVFAAIAYGYYISNRDVSVMANEPYMQEQAVNPTTDGTTSSMIGTGPMSDELTPSPVAPGTPDTTTTESTTVPVDGLE